MTVVGTYRGPWRVAEKALDRQTASTLSLAGDLTLKLADGQRV